MNNLQQSDLKFQNWKIVNNSKENLEQEFKGKNDKWYILIYANKFILKEKYNQDDKIKLFDFNNYTGIKFGDAKYATIERLTFYRWDGNGESQTPKIETNGKLIFWTDNEYQNNRSFLLKYINYIVQENIRVQQGGNPDYDDPNLGSEKIIFDFEIVDESLAQNSFKSIYRMILTIDERKNIITGSLGLFHNWKYADDPVKNQKDKLGFLFTFMKEKDNIFNFDGNTNLYLENGNIKYYEKMKGQININKFKGDCPEICVSS